LGSCNRDEGRICTEEGEGVSIVKGRERRDVGVHTGIIEERVHLTLKVVSNSTGVLCREERREKENGARLSISQ